MREGRLILADALSLACEDEPDAIVDLATLTGACMVALGPSIAGLMGNDDPLIDEIRAAADRAGERVWPLPLPADYAKQFESNVADMKNIGGTHGGALTAGADPSAVRGRRHPLGPTSTSPARPGPSRTTARFARGGTGFGVRTLIELALSYSASD